MKRFFENLHDHIILLIYEYVSYTDLLNLLINVDKKELIYKPLQILPLQTCSCPNYVKNSPNIASKINVRHGLSHSYIPEHYYSLDNIPNNLALSSYYSQYIKIVAIDDCRYYLSSYKSYKMYPIIFPKLHTVILYLDNGNYKNYMDFFKSNKNTIHTLTIPYFKNYNMYYKQYNSLKVLKGVKTLLLDCLNVVKPIHIHNMMKQFPQLERVIITGTFRYKYKNRNFIDDLRSKFKNIFILLSHTDPNVNTIIKADVQKYSNVLFSSLLNYSYCHCYKLDVLNKLLSSLIIK